MLDEYKIENFKFNQSVNWLNENLVYCLFAATF